MYFFMDTQPWHILSDSIHVLPEDFWIKHMSCSTPRSDMCEYTCSQTNINKSVTRPCNVSGVCPSTVDCMKMGVRSGSEKWSLKSAFFLSATRGRYAWLQKLKVLQKFMRKTGSNLVNYGHSSCAAAFYILASSIGVISVHYTVVSQQIFPLNDLSVITKCTTACIKMPWGFLVHISFTLLQISRSVVSEHVILSVACLTLKVVCLWVEVTS